MTDPQLDRSPVTRSVIARVHRVTVEVVFVQVYVLAGQLAAPEVPKHLEVVIYPHKPLVILIPFVVRSFLADEPFSLLGEFLYGLHHALRHGFASTYRLRIILSERSAGKPGQTPNVNLDQFANRAKNMRRGDLAGLRIGQRHDSLPKRSQLA